MEQICKEKVFNVPNTLTLIRIVLLPVIAWRYRIGDRTSALIVYLAAMLTDVLDGWIARKTGQITSVGRLLDPIADKLSLLTLLVLFVMDRQIPTGVLVVICLKEILMVLGGAAALFNGIVTSAQPIGKLTTLLFTVSILLRFIRCTYAADVSMYTAAVMSIAALAWYGKSVLSELENKDSTLGFDSNMKTGG